MNDFDYDVLQKKRVASSARARVNGSRSRYVSLPSDNLTAAEKRKMNGEVVVYKLSEPISWVEFKSYPHDIQVKYLEFLRDEFGASNAWFKRVMGIGDGTLYPYFTDHKLKGILLKYPETSNRDKFEAWLKSNGVPPTEEPKPKKEKVVTPPPMFYNVISSCEMNLSGKASEISQMLYNIFQNQRIIVQVVLDAEQPENDDVEEIDNDCI